jgi:UDP-N-acetylmuramoyl-L-alanyl-D-glutamate--2,6-diaminopimelate ligase
MDCMATSIQFPTTFPVTAHTNFVGKGSTFVVIKGAKEDGIAYIPLALQKGATRIVLQQELLLPDELLQAISDAQAHILRVENTRRALAHLSAQALNHPARKLKIIGITGTKGKTTSTYVLEHILRSAGHKTALLSTVRNKILDQEFSTTLTTQLPDYLHVFFDCAVKAGVEYVIMEVAAQGLSLHRVAGIEFDGAIFTNFAQEHGEFYPTLEEYFKAKCLLFDHVKAGAPFLINADDVWCNQLVKIPQSGRYAFGKEKGCDFMLTLESSAADMVKFILSFQGNAHSFYCPSLVGTFNVYNLAGAIALAISLGIAPSIIADAVQSFNKVPGRLERYALPNGATAFIDYAHNPSSFIAVLSALRPLTSNLIVVFGCGGDRDTAKRPLMGEIASLIADCVIVTTDNPRTEDPRLITKEIVAGVPAHSKAQILPILDREMAIRKAYEISKPGSVIALLGLGPDEYLIFGNQKTFFSEAQILRSLQ